jgi:hypothetical protein
MRNMAFLAKNNYLGIILFSSGILFSVLSVVANSRSDVFDLSNRFFGSVLFFTGFSLILIGIFKTYNLNDKWLKLIDLIWMFGAAAAAITALTSLYYDGTSELWKSAIEVMNVRRNIIQTESSKVFSEKCQNNIDPRHLNSDNFCTNLFRLKIRTVNEHPTPSEIERVIKYNKIDLDVQNKITSAANDIFADKQIYDNTLFKLLSESKDRLKVSWLTLMIMLVSLRFTKSAVEVIRQFFENSRR